MIVKLTKKTNLINYALLGVGIAAIFFSLIPLPFAARESYDVPKFLNLFNESFVVPVGKVHKTAILHGGDLIHIYFVVTSGGNLDVDFFVMDELNYFEWGSHESYSAQISLSRTTSYDHDFTVPQNATWYFVWNNNFSSTVQKSVTANISKHWNEEAYRDVTVYHLIVPAQYARYIEYLGIILVLVGLAMAGGRYAIKVKTPAMPVPANWKNALKSKQRLIEYWKKVKETIHLFDDIIVKYEIQWSAILLAIAGASAAVYSSTNTIVDSSLLAGIVALTAFLISIPILIKCWFYYELLEEALRVAKNVENAIFNANADKIGLTHKLTQISTKRLLGITFFGWTILVPFIFLSLMSLTLMVYYLSHFFGWVL